MTDDLHLSSYEDTPVYTIKTVVQETGIPPATLRAWERRYGVLSPGRSEGGYRLYSERDIAVLRWLKRQVDAGVSISRAVALRELRHPAEADEAWPTSSTARLPKGARSPQAISDDLLAALMAFEEARADALLSEAFALYPVEMVVEETMIPVLIEVGERWHRGEATVVQEHFATAVLRRRLTAMFHAYDQPAGGRLAITGAAPAEWHDVGILLVSLALRRNGWRVIYLGQNIPADQLLQEVRRLRPDLLCLSATSRASAGDLVQVYESVALLPAPRPRLAFGGRAFNLIPELRDRFAGAYIGASASDLIATLK
jgi:DNA-binding transcriptional MerR regulator/methylmalonyl-CoA mutase cobalamin-binding subunit